MTLSKFLAEDAQVFRRHCTKLSRQSNMATRICAALA